LGRHRRDRLDGGVDRLAHDDHAGAAAEGPIVHAFVLARRPVAEVPQVNLDQPRLDRPLPQALGQGARGDLWEQGQHVEAHQPPVGAGTGVGSPPAGACAGADGPSATFCSHLAMYFFKSTATCSDGWAPTESQYLMRSGTSVTRSSLAFRCGS